MVNGLSNTGALALAISRSLPRFAKPVQSAWATAREADPV
jgi:hypothetical protein